MKIRFNKYEKVAGLFVGIAITASVVGLLGIAAKNGWFARKVKYATEIESADGVHAGTIVQISGLRVGAVTAVELQANDRVRVEFQVIEKFASKIRSDSAVQMYRPFILSDKVLDVSVGAEGSEFLPPGSLIPTHASSDIMDMLSGRKMGMILSSFDNLASSLKIVGTAFSNPQRTKDLVRMMDSLRPLVENVNTMSKEIIKITTVANRALPTFQKEVPDMGHQMAQIVKNLNILTAELQKLTPAISVIAPELPRTSRRAVEALDETVVLLKALQRSFLLRGNVEQVRDEEGRKPTNATEP
jgi:phospholipid/cholesterol/gamma-HCH transport system substrate-binding protein